CRSESAPSVQGLDERPSHIEARRPPYKNLETAMTTQSPHSHPVDERLPILKLAALGMQHVLVMYAGAIAVPLIVGGALNLPKSEIAYLISADLFCCGLVTIIQS